jgi:pentatricopeptide repeat protein
MRGAAFQPDNMNYSLVFQACAKKPTNVDVISRVCADIKQEGLDMDNKLYNDVINAYCCVGKHDKAFYYMDLMQACDLYLDSRSYGVLIEMLVVARRIDDAEAPFFSISWLVFIVLFFSLIWHRPLSKTNQFFFKIHRFTMY